jgi:hypothetical protein
MNAAMRNPRLPEAVGNPGRHRARDQQAAEDVAGDGGPVHHEVRGGGVEALPREEPLENRSPALDRHVHLGVAFHGAQHPAVGLLARCWRRRGVRNRRNITTTIQIIIGPPTNSPAVNCPPRTSAMMIPSSTTRFDEAISNPIAAVKFAPSPPKAPWCCVDEWASFGPTLTPPAPAAPRYSHQDRTI